MKQSHTPIGDQRIAVIILNWNGERLLREYLPQVLATTDSAISRVIVADNGSTDGSVGYLRATYGDTVGLIAFDRNYGFAEGYNRAIDLCRTFPYTVLLNSDVATTDGWDRDLLAYMEAHHTCAAAQPKLLADKARDTFEYAGAAGGMIDRYGYPYCRGRIFDTCERDSGQYDTEADLAWASGACLMVRTHLYIQAGGLDTLFFAHMEEIDLCWRLRRMGYTIGYQPRAVVYHLGGASLPAQNPFKTYLNFRNNLLMLYKNLPARQARTLLVKRRLLDTLAWLKYVLTLDWRNAAAIVRAHRHFASMRSNYTPADTDMTMEHTPGADVNILSNYFLRGRKTYSSLHH